MIIYVPDDVVADELMAIYKFVANTYENTSWMRGIFIKIEIHNAPLAAKDISANETRALDVLMYGIKKILK